MAFPSKGQEENLRATNTMSPALSPRVQGHTTSLKSFRLFSPHQEGILFKKHSKPPDTSGAIQVPNTTSDNVKTSRGPRETQALLHHSWRPGEISERLLLPHCCPSTSSPGSKGMQQGRGQSHTVEYKHQWAHRKENSTFPPTGNRKHVTPSAPHLLYMYLFIGKKVCEAALQVKDDRILLHSMEKQTGYTGFRSWALLLKFNMSSPGRRREWWGEIKVQKLNFSCCPWLPSCLDLQHFLMVLNRNDHTSQALPNS